eukprot:612425_1
MKGSSLFWIVLGLLVACPNSIAEDSQKDASESQNGEKSDKESTKALLDFVGDRTAPGDSQESPSESKSFKFESPASLAEEVERLLGLDTDESEGDRPAKTEPSEEEKEDRRLQQKRLAEADDKRNLEGIHEAISLYIPLAAHNVTGALNALGEIYLRGEFGSVQSTTQALDYFSIGADLGDAVSQHNLAVMYAGGIGVERDPAKALLYDFFASSGKSVEAYMSMGYRHMFGIGVPKSCKAAVKYYEKAADKTISDIQSGVQYVSGMVPLDDPVKRTETNEEDPDVIHYLDQAARGGDHHAEYQMGRLQMYGLRGVEHNPQAAVDNLRGAANVGNAPAMALLGHMYLEGNGVKQNNETAFRYFSLASAKGDPMGQNGLGYMYEHGIGTERDLAKALKEFQRAANRNDPDAQFHLASMYYNGQGMDRPDFSEAYKYFTKAGKNGHTAALFNLAVMTLHGQGTMKSCKMGLQLLKKVAERGARSADMDEAHKAYLRGDVAESLALYLTLAEEGYQLAQQNAAWLLSQNLADPPAPPEVSPADPEDTTPLQSSNFTTDDRVFRLLTFAADQGSVSAPRQLGDHLFGGVVSEALIQELNMHELPVASVSSTSKVSVVSPKSAADGPELNFARALNQYARGSKRHDSESTFNLGYMHHFGYGVRRDSHIAKRNYDLALKQESKSYLPVKLALWTLRISDYSSDFTFSVHFPDFRGFADVDFYSFAENSILFMAVSGLVAILVHRVVYRGGLWN